MVSEDLLKDACGKIVIEWVVFVTKYEINFSAAVAVLLILNRDICSLS